MIEEKIPVIILGQTYEILGNPSDALYYNSLARYIEEKMKEIQQMTHIVSTQKIAVLAALNIADELFQDRENKSSSSNSQEKKQEDLIKLLEQTLKETTVE
ncbi:MAG: cell division protein ZapA [Elusimicrobia bacterium]|nr:cell division protein ZapA [Elusimicrobiota bacterium]